MFGPTIELMMQYEDFNLPNLITKMYFEGIVPMRPTQNKYNKELQYIMIKVLKFKKNETE